MIIGIRGWQDTGKTALAIGIIQELVFNHGYDFNEVVANIHLDFPVDIKPHYLENPKMREFIKSVVSRGLKHKIIMLDEADRLFPARFWQNTEQTDALIGLWQDYKLFNYVIWTGHKGTSVDILLRLTTQMELEPSYDQKNDCIPFIIYDGLHGRVDNDCLLNVSKRIFPYYHRWEVVV